MKPDDAFMYGYMVGVAPVLLAIIINAIVEWRSGL